MITQIIASVCMLLGVFMEKLKYSNITEKVIGCAMKVHRKIGNSKTNRYLCNPKISVICGSD
jgi:hypothetical protein